MFQVKANSIRRVCFATRLFPHLDTSLGIDVKKLKVAQDFDGEVFCGGRSKNKDLLTFFNFITSSDTPAAFVQLPNFRRSIRKLTDLIELELEKVGAQQILLPTIVPEKLWLQSKRLERQKSALDNVYKFEDNDGKKLLVGPTFEESVTRMMVALEKVTESDLPLLFYQTSSKYRYEPNPKFGLLRTNEFIMNDTYSFDATLEKANDTYAKMSHVYDKLFKKLGLDYVKVESGCGDIGGKYSHEYQLPVSSGEDTILECKVCLKAFNAEIPAQDEQSCCSNIENQYKRQAIELGHTFLLSDVYSEPLKATFTNNGGKKAHFQMGCYGLGLTRIIGAGLDLLSLMPDSNENINKLIQMRWPTGIEPYQVAVVAPAKRSKQYHNGSTSFIEKIVNRILESTRTLDILVEDRDKEGIGKRVMGLQTLGIPNIIVVGQRFLDDPPQVELLKLAPDKKHYNQHWFTEDQLYNYSDELDKQNICD